MHFAENSFFRDGKISLKRKGDVSEDAIPTKFLKMSPRRGNAVVFTTSNNNQDHNYNI